MSADKYPSIFSPQMEAIVYIFVNCLSFVTAHLLFLKTDPERLLNCLLISFSLAFQNDQFSSLLICAIVTLLGFYSASLQDSRLRRA